jgi:hypothetical protein
MSLPAAPCTRSATPGKLSAFDDELYRSAEMAEVPVVVAITITTAEGQATVVRRGGCKR